MNKQRQLTGHRRDRGQALLLALIVLLALALLGAAMVAVVSSGLEDSARDEHRVRARLLAQAGLRYADEMLTGSPQGADWRPRPEATLIPDADTVNKKLAGAGGTDPAFDQTIYDATWDSFEVLRGWDSISQQRGTTPVYFVKYRLAMEPDTLSTATETVPHDDPSQDFVNPAQPVTPVENAELTSPHDHFLLKVEFQPNSADPLSKYLKITSIGRPGNSVTAFHQLVAYKPVALQDYLLFVHDLDRQAATVTLGQPAIDVDGDGQTNTSMRAAGTWTTGAAEDYIPLWLRGPVRTNTNLQALAPLRFEPSESASGWKESVEVAGSLNSVVDGAATAGDKEVQVQNATASGFDVFSNDSTAAVAQVQPTTPTSQTWPSQLQVGVGRRVEAPPLESYESGTGVARWDRLTRYSGNDITITVGGQSVRLNSGELGYGAGIYVDNEGQREDFRTAANAWFRPETWGGRQYIPNGCIVELYAHYPDELDATKPPAVAITLTDGSTWVDPGTGASTGKRTMVYDFPDKQGTWSLSGTNGPAPKNGVIVCEGNVRIYGRLPAPAVGSTADYNLTVVSRGSIYVDGPLLRPSDYQDGIAEDSPRNTRVALLAHDNVVINPTTLAPGLVPGMAAPPFTSSASAPADPYWTLDATGTRAIGLRAAVCRQPDGSAPPPIATLSVLDADGNLDDGLPARTSVLLARTRATIGLTPVAPPATLAAPALLAYDTPGSTGVFMPVYFADWANLGRAVYSATPFEYRPDELSVDPANFNADPAAGTMGVPSYVYLAGGVNLANGSNPETRSDVIVKNVKLERDLGYLPGLEFPVNALMYAERGSLYVIPGDWFDERASSAAAMRDAKGTTTVVQAQQRYARYRRYNYRVSIKGAIAVNTLPSLNEVGDWTAKWAYPTSDSATNLLASYDAVQYRYDWGLRAASTRPNALRLPYLPASPGLIHIGEENQR